jgi:hypothetical protein
MALTMILSVYSRDLLVEDLLDINSLIIFCSGNTKVGGVGSGIHITQCAGFACSFQTASNIRDGYGMLYPYHAGCIEKVPKRSPRYIQVLKHL